MIPPEADAEFAAHMEQVLDAYARPYDAACPVLCMDEQPVQLTRETRCPIAAAADRPRRVDYEYERAGTASIFLFCEPLAGWRRATARARRTKADWAREVAELLEGRYADHERITLVSDNLTPHGVRSTFHTRALEHGVNSGGRGDQPEPPLGHQLVAHVRQPDGRRSIRHAGLDIEAAARAGVGSTLVVEQC